MTNLLIAAFILSAAFGFLSALINTKRRFGGEYVEVMLWCWGQIVLVLTPITIYAISAANAGGWQKIVYSPEVGMGATLIYLLAAQELTAGLTLDRTFPVRRRRVAMLGQLTLVLLCVSVATVVLMFSATELTVWSFVWQLVLLVLSVPIFFATAAVVRLIEFGHIPESRA